MILLDTVVLLIIAGEGPMRLAARSAITGAAAGALTVSAVSAFEIGSLASTRRTGRLIGDPERWWREIIRRLGARVIDIDSVIALEAARTPGLRDPADRVVVATARLAGATLLTKDRRMLALADAGHVAAIAC